MALQSHEEVVKPLYGSTKQKEVVKPMYGSAKPAQKMQQMFKILLNGESLFSEQKLASGRCSSETSSFPPQGDANLTVKLPTASSDGPGVKGILLLSEDIQNVLKRTENRGIFGKQNRRHPVSQ
eukprot:gene997-10774_t